jgi:hypothetical protein
MGRQSRWSELDIHPPGWKRPPAKPPAGERLDTVSQTNYWEQQKEADAKFQARLRKHHPEREGLCEAPGTAFPQHYARPITKHAPSSMGGNYDWDKLG